LRELSDFIIEVEFCAGHSWYSLADWAKLRTEMGMGRKSCLVFGTFEDSFQAGMTLKNNYDGTRSLLDLK